MEAVIERRAPKNGYDNDEKQKYRHDVWRVLSEKCLDRLSQSDAYKVLLLPSKEGIEIDVAMSYGIKPHQIVAIDENPALIAVSKWRKKHPEVKYFGKKVSEIGKVIQDKGWTLAAANLDFCNNFSAELIQEVNGFFEKTPVTKDFSFFVTMAKGRESSALAMLLKKDGVPDAFIHPRIATLYKMMGFLPKDKLKMAIDFQGQYVSNRVPMLYACFSFHPFNIEVFKKEKFRYEILYKRQWRLESHVVSRNEGYSKRALSESTQDLKDMKRGLYFELLCDGTDKKISKEYKEELITETKAEITKLKRYKKNNICDYSLRCKRERLKRRVEKEIHELLTNIKTMVSLYAEKNGLINSEEFIYNYVKRFVSFKIKDGV